MLKDPKLVWAKINEHSICIVKVLISIDILQGIYQNTKHININLAISLLHIYLHMQFTQSFMNNDFSCSPVSKIKIKKLPSYHQCKLDNQLFYIYFMQ